MKHVAPAQADRDGRKVGAVAMTYLFRLDHGGLLESDVRMASKRAEAGPVAHAFPLLYPPMRGNGARVGGGCRCADCC